MTPRLNRVLLALVLLVGLPYYWLLLDNRSGGVPAKPVTMAQLRAAAAALPGPPPDAIEMELVAFRRLPGTLFAAGSGIKRRLIGVMAWRLTVPGRGPIVIDTALDEPAARRLRMERFIPQAWQRVAGNLAAASLVVVTHEHPDHLGGLLALGRADVLARARFNAAQRPGNPLTDRQSWPAVPPPATLAGAAPIAVAPGVVVIPAPSHTPGSQMVYVRLASGREYLLTGDIATLGQSWQEDRARSRLIGDWLVRENRAEVYAWLATIRALKAAAPGLVVLPGHDFEWIVDPLNGTGIHNGFGPLTN